MESSQSRENAKNKPLHVPREYQFPRTASLNVLAARKDWLGSLVRGDDEVFRTHDTLDAAEVHQAISLLECLGKDWVYLLVQRHESDEEKECIPLLQPAFSFSGSSKELSFSQALHFLSSTNHKNLWKAASTKHFCMSTPLKPARSKSNDVQTLPVSRVIQTASRRLFPSSSLTPSSEGGVRRVSLCSAHLGLCRPLLIEETDSESTLIFLPLSLHSLWDCLSFSSSITKENVVKPLFIIYQIIHALARIHDLGCFAGDLTMSEILIDERLWIQIIPKLDSNFHTCTKGRTRSLTEERCSQSPISAENDESLPRLVEMWARGSLSNYDYLMKLNALAGRRMGDPKYHPVLPWVIDFSQPNGKWRDLSRSKFRLSKGDNHLDLMYESATASGNESPDIFQISLTLIVYVHAFMSRIIESQQQQVAHHIPEVLSEITYYVYKARRMPQSVLCKHVRSKWVPNEYPASIVRLQEWTPDECIPEFYSDPSIFKSTHEDLPDLAIPAWSSCPEDFIKRHREALESLYVSERLHHWIDLTFGDSPSHEKGLSGDSSGEATEDRKQKDEEGSRAAAFQRLLSRSPKLSTSVEPGNEVPVPLPKDYSPISLLNQVEHLYSFIAGIAGHCPQPLSTGSQGSPQNSFLRLLVSRRKERDLQALACLMLEVFMPSTFQILGSCSSLEQRVHLASSVISQDPKAIPICIREAVASLLNHDSSTVITEKGTPPLTPQLLLQPLISPIPFPSSFSVIYSIAGEISDLHWSLRKKEILSDTEEGLARHSACVVKGTVASLSPVILQLSNEELDLVVPHIKALFRWPQTRVLAAWHLLDPIGQALGPEKTSHHFLPELTALMSCENATEKHLKLFHKSFLLQLLVRLGVKSFLAHFLSILVEALGGCRDSGDAASHQHNLKSLPDEPTSSETQTPKKVETPANAEPGVFEFEEEELRGARGEEEDAEEKEVGEEPLAISHDSLDPTPPLKTCQVGISDMCMESILWLAERLGPVLTARHITRNLLKMLTLCYLEETCLYGEAFVTLQYLPHVMELVASCKQRISVTLEAGLIGALALVPHALDCLRDATLMELLSETLIRRIVYPATQLASSRSLTFPHGEKARSAVIWKTFAVLKVISMRIGFEMSKKHLTAVIVRFFRSFSLAHETDKDDAECHRSTESDTGSDLDNSGYFNIEKDEEKGSYTVKGLVHLEQVDSPADLGFPLSPSEHQIPIPERVEEELKEVFSCELAHEAYITFCHLAGNMHLDRHLCNTKLIRLLYDEHEVKLKKLSPSSSSSSISSRNHFMHSDATARAGETNSSSSTRHVKGNWLAYWEHAIGKPDVPGTFDFKGIPLQGFLGHTANTRSIVVLDNENSFISGGKDRTVRLWSLRNQGDGSCQMACRWVYGHHKKSIVSLAYLDGPRLIASCDSSVHVWDPFMTSPVLQVEGGKHPPVTCLIPFPSAPQRILVGTSEGTLRFLDIRASKYVCDLKTSYLAGGVVRSLCTSSDGHRVAIGHSTGILSVLDLRSGFLLNSWKAHDGEILNLVSGRTKGFVSSSMDQSLMVWSWEDGKVLGLLKGSSEPSHCLSVMGSQLVTATTANRIGVHSGFEEPPGTLAGVRLKLETFKGMITSLATLPLNELLLLGSDNGSIWLFS
ncbi:unnamed protein product [Darwinula stevensoni]|uniref:BEACH domain-containing protein n=1 Tax=Darwinula stevensoni TaxID=69355 RepID=A0A7R9A7D7_9CRUS|nr:unnamed protein product [Darwinula stevensoni]CAG0892872.1 unnamed protein product [Darwinula stevensoni]